MFERAVALDPANAFGLIGVAAVDTAVALNFFPDDRAARLAAAEAAAIKALSLAPENAAAHLCLGVVQIHTNRASEGVRHASGRYSWIEIWPTRTRSLATARFCSAKPRRPRLTSRRRCASVPAMGMFICGVCLPVWPIFISAERKKRSRGCAAPSKLTGPSPSSHFLLAAALARLGRLPEARSEARTGLALFPTFTISKFRASAWSDHPAVAAVGSATLTACARPACLRDDRARGAGADERLAERTKSTNPRAPSNKPRAASVPVVYPALLRPEVRSFRSGVATSVFAHSFGRVSR